MEIKVLPLVISAASFSYDAMAGIRKRSQESNPGCAAQQENFAAGLIMGTETESSVTVCDAVCSEDDFKTEDSLEACFEYIKLHQEVYQGQVALGVFGIGESISISFTPVLQKLQSMRNGKPLYALLMKSKSAFFQMVVLRQTENGTFSQELYRPQDKVIINETNQNVNTDEPGFELGCGLSRVCVCAGAAAADARRAAEWADTVHRTHSDGDPVIIRDLYFIAQQLKAPISEEYKKERENVYCRAASASASAQSAQCVAEMLNAVSTMAKKKKMQG